ncbi:hypothetical protein [Belliella pelovolcani]|uniref:Seryl-tRNA synthetase n=1 Tax=Belliella pelovolcani TaxID=529505 RepID=A0A1N7KI60_9BACT|nr:hypothetical protein [Belliella pelovolcani]SIS61256.1 hypothetical protein SAMN05421761_10299 [Belliella pelovolcani]
MKKFFINICFAILLFGGTATAAFAKGETTTKDVEIAPEVKVRLDEIESRVNEIKAMDFTELSKEERKEIRSELKELKKEAKSNGGGLYISTGALIVILILLIILL